MSVSDHPLAPAFERFAELIARRLERRVPSSEDSVRYTFFAALTQTLELAPDDVVLEHDHVAIARAKIDTFIPDFRGRAYVIEFKYDRAVPSGTNPPLTQKAELLKDLFRLARVDAHGVGVRVRGLA